MTMWPLVLTSSVVDLVPAVSWVLELLLSWLVGLDSILSTLSIAHLGYLQLVTDFLRWSIYFWKSSGLLHTVLALWLRVLITLYADRWWQMSHCRYWSVWVVYCDRQSTISLWFDNGIQEGDDRIFLFVFHHKLYGQVNTINVF